MTKQKRSPAFQFYPNDFLGSPKVQVMTVEEVGLYWLLLCLDWQQNGFTINEAREFARAKGMDSGRFDDAWTRVSRCFVVNSAGSYFNGRLEEERRKQAAWRRKCSKGGKLSAAKRSKGSSRVVEGYRNTPSLSPSPTPSLKQKQGARATSDGDAIFAEAWAEYPKRPGNSKADSYRQWLARVKEGVDPLTMLEGTRRYAKYIAANPPEEARFIKQAQTFYGRGKHFDADWTSTVAPDSLANRVALVVEEEDAALERTRALLAKRGVA